MHGTRAAAESCILICMHQAGGRELLWFFEISKITSSNTPLLIMIHLHICVNKAIPPNLSQIVVLTRDQAFKHTSLWGIVSFELQITWLFWDLSSSNLLSVGIIGVGYHA